VLHCHSEPEGSQSDLRIFRENHPMISPKVRLDADLGYQGIDKLHGKTKTPFKTPREGTLTKNQRRKNKRFRRKRVRIEHTIRKCKVFRIVKERYRNKRRRLQTVWSVICGLVNYKYFK
jgi:hypothetical protein